jgi:3-isopropylmalate/(R)-2-methylmalate dehydratase large subunit
MGQTIAEKIISRHAGATVHAGDIAIVDVDGTMATDATAPFAIRAFQEMGGEDLWDPERVFLVLDHATPAPTERIGNLHQLMREFATETGCTLYDVGAGICHQLMVEQDHVRPGDIFLGADSHTPTYGALGAFAVGVGSTDMAAVMLTGKTWLKVPQTVRIELTGELQPGVGPKDIILFLVGTLGIAGATYDAIEFSGDAVDTLSLAGRMTLANMVAEMGAKAALVDTLTLQSPYSFTPITGDEDAVYRAVHTFEVSGLRPQISLPHAPDQVIDIDSALGTEVQSAFIGSCTNGRLEDLHAAASVLRDRHVAPGVRLTIATASRRVFNAAVQDGTVAALSAAGASFITSGCGPCVGTHQGVPGDGEVVISSSNRNFRGRMGNPRASIYLASPTVVAAAALTGKIVDPADIISEQRSP